MKKRVFPVLSSLILLASLNGAFASVSSCPPSDKIKSMALTQASALGYQHRWSLASDSFKQNGRYWNLYFIVELPNAKTRAEALQQGKEYFTKTIIANNDPIPYNSDSMTYCDYTREAKYAITAASAVEDGVK